MTTDILETARVRVLDEGRGLDAAQALECLTLPDERLPDLLALAHEVRMKWCGPEVEVEGIVSLKTGGCPEDCHFCSQSGQFSSPVRAAWLDIPSLVRAAVETAATGATEFCIVAAVRGPDRRLMDQVREGVKAIREAVDINVACSLGMLTQTQVNELAEMGVHRYNHNLETARSHFPRVVTTHTWEERWDTCLMVREAGMELCCGGIVGMGETLEQRAEFAAQLGELAPDEVPLNFLNPRPGTPFGRPAPSLGHRGAEDDRHVPPRPAAYDPALRRGPRADPGRPRHEGRHAGRRQRHHRRQLPDHSGPRARARSGAARRPQDAHQGAVPDPLTPPVVIGWNPSLRWRSSRGDTGHHFWNTPK